MIPVGWYFALAAGLFAIGLYLVMSSRNAIRVLMGVELMLNAANVNFAAFSGFAPDAGGFYVNNAGFTFAFFSIAIAAAEAAVGLAIFINLFRLRLSPNIDRADILRW